VMKGKKTITSLRDAVSTELARVKIEANAIADRIQLNLKVLSEHPGFEFLFADLAQIAVKANDDFAILVKARIGDERMRVEAERDRIRQEEEAKARAAVIAANTPAPAAQPAPVERSSTPAAASRPSDDQLIAYLASGYAVSESLVVAWLAKIDLNAAAQKRAATKAAA